MVLKFVAWLHLVVFRLAAWLVGLGLKGIGKWLLVIVALLGEEFRRWAGLILSGAIIVGMGKLMLGLPDMPGKRWVIMADLLFLAVWAYAVRRAVRYTMRNSLMRVRNKQAIKGMAADIAVVRGRVTEGLAKATRDTPMGGAFRSNREATAKAEAAAQTAADRAAAEREAQARREAEEAAEQRRLDTLGPDHDPYVRSGR